MKAVLLSNDLMAQSRVSGPLQAEGWQFQAIGSASGLLEVADDTTVVMLDLSTPGCNPTTLVAQLRSLPRPPRAIVAFAPHVHVQLLQAAREAGCEGVYARGQFYGQSASILAPFQPAAED